jgi:hypothetical protein
MPAARSLTPQRWALLITRSPDFQSIKFLSAFNYALYRELCDGARGFANESGIDRRLIWLMTWLVTGLVDRSERTWLVIPAEAGIHCPGSCEHAKNWIPA